MLLKGKDENQDDRQPPPLRDLRDALVKLHEDIHDPASYKKWEDMEAKEILKEINLPNLDLQAALENLQYWPEEIQKYFAKEVIESIRDSRSTNYDQKDLEVLYEYLETALIKLPECADGQYPEAQLERAMKAVSRQLQRYYGREDDDEEFPGWPRPR